MPIFQYQANTESGRTKRGQIVAVSDQDAISKLRRRDLSVTNIRDITNEWSGRIFQFISPIKNKDLVIFARQFSVMISANVPIVESLVVLIEQTNNLTLKNLIANLAFDVDSGSFLSDALAKYPKHFSSLFINIIRSGETSGKLDEVLSYLADEMEKNYDMVSKIKGAMIYPVFIVTALVGVGIVLMVYVIPNVVVILEETGAQLPLSTRLVIATSNFLSSYLWLLFGLIFLAVVGFRYALKTYAVKRTWDLIKIKLPIFGQLFQYIYLMRFTRSLSTLLKGGVAITKSLEIVADVVGNIIYRELVLDTLDSINDGNPLATVFDNSSRIPRMVPQMIAVGERTGQIDTVLDRLTAFYDRESSNMLDNLSKLMEPMIMIIMGIGVGVMVAAVLLPMYNLASQF